MKTLTTLIALALDRPPKPMDIPEFRPLLPEQKQVANRLWLQYADEAHARFRSKDVLPKIRIAV